jgi:hypothetical protein
MPATAKKGDVPKRVRALVDELSAALSQRGSSRDEPLIVEDRIAQTQSVHVVVIWDGWKDLSPKDRSKIIEDAYASARQLRGSTITVAMGLTGEEALRMGFLPYSIVTTHRQGDKTSLGKLTRAMADAGGIMIKVGSSTQLRFPRLEQAEDAYRDLSQKVPGPYWAIVHEQPASQ